MSSSSGRAFTIKTDIRAEGGSQIRVLVRTVYYLETVKKYKKMMRFFIEWMIRTVQVIPTDKNIRETKEGNK